MAGPRHALTLRSKIIGQVHWVVDVCLQAVLDLRHFARGFEGWVWWKNSEVPERGPGQSFWGQNPPKAERLFAVMCPLGVQIWPPNWFFDL